MLQGKTGKSGKGRAARRLTMMALAAAAAFALFASAAGAAGTITLEPGKGGVNADGSCGQVSGTGTNLEWQFNLTGIKDGGANALLTATFTQGGVTNISPDVVNGGVAKWFVTTTASAKLVSASADGTNVTFNNGHPNLVVSHCTGTGGSSGPPS